MAFRLHTACRIDSFIKHLPEIFSPKTLLGTPPRVVIQNRNMGEWIKLELARSEGVSAGLEMSFPEQALRSYMEEFPHPYGDRTILFMDNLKVVLYQTLREILKEDNPEFRIPKDYLLKGNPAKEESLENRLYQLSNLLGGLFYHYGMNCPQLSRSWEEDRVFPTEDPIKEEHQQWQKALWQRLFCGDSSYVHLSKILEHIQLEELPYPGEKVPLILFGSSFLGETGLRFFHYLSRYVDVDFYYAIPSKIFSPRNGHEPAHISWENWSSLAEGISQLLREWNISQGEDYPPQPFPSGILGDIQRSLWTNQEYKGPVIPSTEQPELFSSEVSNDGSLKIYSASSSRRQVEAMKGQILQLLEEDPQLQLSDICIMAPDISEFAPYIEGIFPYSQGKDDELPCHYIDLKRQGDAVFTQGFLKMLSLAGSRYTRPEIFSLFQNPCFASAWDIHERRYQDWLEICDRLNILWGFDENQKRSMDLGEKGVHTWKWGFQRLLLGMVYPNESDDPKSPWTDLRESEFEDMGHWMRLMEELHEDLESLFQGKHPLEEWVLRLEELMEKNLKPRKDHPQDNIDRLAVKAVFRNINNLIDGLQWERGSKKFSWTFISQLIQELIEKTDRKKGHYLTQGISCSSLKPLRGIPFKVICLLGMDSQSFPSREIQWNFDLKDLTKPKVDLSRRASDTFSFLETLMSVGDRLLIFYQGRNPVSGENQLPSPVVNELMELAGINEDEVIPIPLHSFDPRHFSPRESIASYNMRDWERAKRLLSPRIDFPATIQPLSGQEEVSVISLRELKNFLENPLKSYCQESLGLRMKNQDIPLEEREVEDYQLAFLQEMGYFRDMEEALIAGEEVNPQGWFEAQRRKGALSLSSWDDIFKEKFLSLADEISQNAAQSLKDLQGWKKGVFAFSSKIENPEEEDGITLCPALEVRLADKVYQIEGILEAFQREGHSRQHQFLYGRNFKSRYAFSSYLDHLLLKSMGISESMELRFQGMGYDIPGKSWNKFQNPPMDELKKIVKLYIENLSRPLVLYPDLVDMAIEKSKGQDFDTIKKNFPAQYRNAWLNHRNPLDLDRCPYGNHFYPQGLVPGESEMALFEQVYPHCSEILWEMFYA